MNYIAMCERERAASVHRVSSTPMNYIAMCERESSLSAPCEQHTYGVYSYV